MSVFEKRLPSFRPVEIRHGDTLQKIAAREMGDATRWPELVWINGLLPPYVTDDPLQASDSILPAGSFIRVPAPSGISSGGAEAGQVYGMDCLLAKKRLSVDADGDLAVVSGVKNLRQQLEHRIVTPLGQARYHPDYGCKVWKLLGTVQGPTAGLMGAAYVKTALLSDYRVMQVVATQAEIVDETIRVAATAEIVSGGTVEVVTE